MQFEENLYVALDGLRMRKLRSLLTMLGIIFGVAAVIAMLSIGEGAKQEAIQKYQVMGINNIIIRDKKLSDMDLEEVRARFSRGLSLDDIDGIRQIVPDVADIAPQVDQAVEARFEDQSLKGTLIGVTSNYLSMVNLNLTRGIFITPEHQQNALRVCVIGAGIVRKLFPHQDPLHKMIKLEEQWFEVIGILETKSLMTETVGELASRDLNLDVYIPLQTFLKRFDRERALESQLTQITVKLSGPERIVEVSNLIRRLINRHHHNNEDFSIILPYELLKQEEKERRIYNILLGSIAAISLLVGGIGIMNIMLATVWERTREIGIRRAVGATQQDILSQFMTEAIAISFTGGVIGIVAGISMSLGIGWVTNVKTCITFLSIFVAFTVSVMVGVVFGMLPARRAAKLDTIESLRYE